MGAYVFHWTRLNDTSIACSMVQSQRETILGIATLHGINVVLSEIKLADPLPDLPLCPAATITCSMVLGSGSVLIEHDQMLTLKRLLLKAWNYGVSNFIVAGSEANRKKSHVIDSSLQQCFDKRYYVCRTPSRFRSF